MKKLIFCFLCLLLASCEPEPRIFNVPLCTWESYTASQQQQAIEDYNQKKIAESKQAPNIFHNPALIQKPRVCRYWPTLWSY